MTVSHLCYAICNNVRFAALTLVEWQCPSLTCLKPSVIACHVLQSLAGELCTFVLGCLQWCPDCCFQAGALAVLQRRLIGKHYTAANG